MTHHFIVSNYIIEQGRDLYLSWTIVWTTEMALGSQNVFTSLVNPSTVVDLFFQPSTSLHANSYSNYNKHIQSGSLINCLTLILLGLESWSFFSSFYPKISNNFIIWCYIFQKFWNDFFAEKWSKYRKNKSQIFPDFSDTYFNP